MTERLKTGSPRLDGILNGGLLTNAINLITGVPGSGKTIMSQQIVFHNATPERPALIFSTLSEPLDKLLRYGQSLNFFDATAVNSGRVVYEEMGDLLGAGKLDEIPAQVERHLKERRPALVVIDSFRAFKVMSHDTTEYRHLLFELTRLLSAAATTSIWNSPYARSNVLDEAEAAVADAILALDVKRIAERELRVLQVLKLRASGYQSGEHVYRITSDGLQVFPRLADPMIDAPYKLSGSRTPTGIAALDELLGEGGYWAGAVTLVAGPSGIGKTLMGLHFLYHGAELGEPGILGTFQETETQLSRVVSSFGWSIDNPDVRVMSRGLVDMNIDEWVYELLDLVEQTGARRVVIDSLLDLASAAGNEVRFREWMFSLTQRFSRAGISLMMIMEVPDLFQIRRISEHGISHLADNVILLQYVQSESELARALTILKTRAMRHQPTVRRYDITNDGFVLGDELTPTR